MNTQSLSEDSEEGSNTESVPPTETVEEATAVTFHFSEPIDFARGEAVLASIAPRELTAERLSVFRRDVDKTNQVASLGLVNDSESSLPPGAVATYELHGSPGKLEVVVDARLGRCRWVKNDSSASQRI